MIKILGKAIAVLTLVLTVIFCLEIKPAMAQPGTSVSMQTFYDELEPYGQWIDDPDYGYVWSPDAGPDFRPYATNGHWVETEYGTTWVSDYDWGWAPFHYGRWLYANDYGWEWIPGTEWGPAWVNWRTGGDYYGWAPLGPDVDIDASFGSNYYAPDNYWVFVPRQYVCSPDIYRYYLPFARNLAIIHNTSIINNVYNDNGRRYISGPRPADLQRYTGGRINVYNINNSSRPGGTRIRNNSLSIYRPEIAMNRNDNTRFAPSRFINRGNNNAGGNGFNNIGGGNGINNRNQNYNNSRQPVNQGNTNVQGNNPANNNNGFGGRRNYGSSNSANGNQPQQQTNPTPNVNGNPASTQPANGNFGRPTRENQPNQNIPNTNAQPNTNGTPNRSFDFNRNRNNNQVPQNQVQQQQQQSPQSQQQWQQRQQQTQQNPQSQQQMQQRQQLHQQRQQQSTPQQQQRPVRENQAEHPQQ